jgi:ATP-dependent Clp protease ATP-binding subunit ClpC
MDNNIFNKFSKNLKKALVEAEKIAFEKNMGLNTEHQLVALLSNKGTLAYEILSGFDITSDRLELIASLMAHSDKNSGPAITDDAKKAVQQAVQIASKYNHQTIGSEHLLLALISAKTFNSYLLIERIGADPKKIKKQIESIFRGIKNSANASGDPINNLGLNPENMMPEDALEDLNFMANPIQPFANQTNSKKENVLESFATNLTRKAQENKLDPVIGREMEINRLVQTLSRRTKNNPILVGEPGVGKTSIVEGLAQKIVNGNVSTRLMNMEIYSVDLGSVLAGTMYRGQFESRIKKILAEIEKRGNVILFVDEIHMMVGAGSTEGSIDAANLLKPMLAKGMLRLIGSTTFEEYKKHIEKDAAFERRFQPIKVAEPSYKETIIILDGIKERYEKFHNVVYTQSAIVAAVELSKRYLNDRFLPDKAIDLMDEAGARTNSNSNPANLKIGSLKKALAETLNKKDSLIAAEKYEEATKLRAKELKLETEIKALSSNSDIKAAKMITEIEIAKLLSDWTGIPASTMTEVEKKRYLNLEKQLKKFVVGQDEAISELAKALKRSRVGISNPLRPIGSFLFLGPTGVGKTELAKVLAREIFGQKDALIKIDMSEFMEKHNVSRLVGAPAGYVGYEEGGKLTEQVRKNPYSVILFDEIEKAHPEVFNILLQIMEDGVLTDAKGRVVDFKNTIIIMTSNLGTDILRRQSIIGFNKAKTDKEKYDSLKQSVLETVEKSFRPEFINRLDQTLIFYPLDMKSIKKIVSLQLNELEGRLNNLNLSIQVNDQVKEWIAEKSYKPEFGARPIRKFIADNIETILSDEILANNLITGSTIKLDLKKGELALTK